MMREKLYWQDSYMRLNSLTVYRGILRDEIINDLLELCRVMAFVPDLAGLSSLYYEFLHKLLVKADALGFRGQILRKYFLYLFLNDENMFTLACERDEPVSQSTLYKLVAKDMNILQYFCLFDIKNICDNVGAGENLTNYIPIIDREDPYIEEIENAETPADKLSVLMWRYRRMGAGDMAVYHMFQLNEAPEGFGLSGISRPDKVVLSEIIGFEYQKEIIVNNTEDFISGRTANNMLLSGSRGNGKSSCVKALVNAYADRGLRLIEVRKDQTHLLPGLLRKLTVRGKYFIIFMDDLSYEQFETQYKYLKSLLEGGAEMKPANVLFYATSNRRHIIRESFNDREEPLSDEELHTTDTVNEKLSLFDRFGVTVTFPNLTREAYLHIVTELAKKRSLMIDTTFLAEQAVKWSLTQKSISGRTAKQFIDHIAGEIARV